MMNGLERMAIFLASRAAKPLFIPEPARFFEVPVPQPLPEVFSSSLSRNFPLADYTGVVWTKSSAHILRGRESPLG